MVRCVFSVILLFTTMMEQRKKHLGFSSSEFGVTAIRNITFWLVERAHLIWELLREEKSIWTGIICYLHKVVLLLTAKGLHLLVMDIFQIDCAEDSKPHTVLLSLLAAG